MQPRVEVNTHRHSCDALKQSRDASVHFFFRKAAEPRLSSCDAERISADISRRAVRPGRQASESARFPETSVEAVEAVDAVIPRRRRRWKAPNVRRVRTAVANPTQPVSHRSVRDGQHVCICWNEVARGPAKSSSSSCVSVSSGHKPVFAIVSVYIATYYIVRGGRKPQAFGREIQFKWLLPRTRLEENRRAHPAGGAACARR